MDIKELKAKAYDRLVQIEALQRDLAQINQQIMQEINKPRTEEPEVNRDRPRAVQMNGQPEVSNEPLG